MKKPAPILIALLPLVLPVDAATIWMQSERPAFNIVAQSNPDGSDRVGFDTEERADNTRYAWGQSFTASDAWELDCISVQRQAEDMFDAVDLDAQIKVVVFDFDSTTFDAEAWGTFGNPSVGPATLPLYTETFSWTNSGSGGDWLTFDLSTNVNLSAGSEYGFALWLSNPSNSPSGTTDGTLTLFKGGSYGGGELLRIRSDTGNTLPGSDLNFILQVPESDIDTNEVVGTVAASPVINLSNGAYSIEVQSADFWNDTDNGVFTATTNLTGDFHVETRVRSIASPPYPWAKAGIMARASRDAQDNAAGIYVTSERGTLFQSRKHEKALTSRVVEGASGSNGYVRLIRKGDLFYGAASSNGQQWVALGNFEWDETPASVEVGIGVAGQDNASVSAEVEPVAEKDIATETGLYGLVLLNNQDGADLRAFYQGDVLDLDHYQAGLSVRAEVASAAAVQSVVFKVDGAPFSIDNTAPFVCDLASLTHGEHLVEAVPYEGTGGSGNTFDSLCVDFNVIRNASATPPNIVYIFCDDLGYADCGFNGSQYVLTPNLDRLAEAGVRCTSGYVTAPQCGPSRAGILSGMYQTRFAYNDNSNHRGLPEAQVAKTGPEILQDLGYTCAMVGKWHIEQVAEGIQAAITSNEVNILPWKRGFDYTYAIDGGGAHYSPYSTGGTYWMTSRNREYRNYERVEGAGTGTLLEAGDYPYGSAEPITSSTYLTTEFTDRAIGFIDRNKTNSFFVYLSYNAPHTPLTPLQSEKDANTHIADSGKRNLAACMTGVDREVGRLLDYLETQNLLDNTLVFFFSDNGGPTDTNHSYNDPFIGFKGDVLEGGIRVPFLISWRGRIPQNRDFHDPVLSLDYIPTILKQQKRSIPDHLDGRPLLDDLQEKTAILKDYPRFFVWRSNYKACRMGDYKKIDQPGGAASGAHEDHFNIVENIREDAGFPPLDGSIASELDALMDEMMNEALNTTNQDAWFDTSDTDSDGLLDAWETAVAGNLSALGAHPADADGDRLSDAQEKLAGTDPLDADDVLEAGLDGQSIAWKTKGLRAYQLNVSTNLVAGNREDLGGVVYGDGSDSMVSVSIDTDTKPSGFYRVEMKE